MARQIRSFRARDKSLQLGHRVRIMGVVNLTPDSFSDGGRFSAPDQAVEYSLGLVQQGADIIDLGGESSRPGSQRIPATEEIDRVMPVLERLRRASSQMISIDTCKVDVAAEAIRLGADLINDVSSLQFDPGLASIIAQSGAGVVLMHMRGTPETMHTLPPSSDILGEISRGLAAAMERAFHAGIPRDKILLDPGIGFGKNAAENLLVLNRLSFLEGLGLPILVGTSRKSFLGRILGLPANERLTGTIVSSVVSVLRGADLVRVHDVREMRQALDVLEALLAESIAE